MIIEPPSRQERQEKKEKGLYILQLVFKGGAMSTTGYAYALFARQFVFTGGMVRF
ncbi:hypothetical protein [Nostoc sp.]|uniref:hypothetical protein n=1 Tax=Nostoc sp. TaxID=1180 RepID=UPI002FF72A82